MPVLQRPERLPAEGGAVAMTSYLLRTLVVQSAGTRLILEGDAVKALREDTQPRRLPLTAIDAIVVLSGVDVSTPLLVRCAEDGRSVTFLSRYGKPRATVSGAFDGRGALRTQQYRRHLDPAGRDGIARAVVGGKIEQMIWGLRQWARDAPTDRAVQLRAAATRLEDDVTSLAQRNRGSALGVEGAATQRYFRAMRLALRDQPFTTRTRRPPRDPVNAVLSFLYSMAGIAVHGGLHAAGLDPFCGYLHGDRDSQPSLVLDLLEEFRPGVDRLVVSLFNRRQLREEHFEHHLGGAVLLNAIGREVVLNAWQRYRIEEVTVRGAVEPLPRAALPIVQATLLAQALRHGADYRPHRLAVI